MENGEKVEQKVEAYTNACNCANCARQLVLPVLQERRRQVAPAKLQAQKQIFQLIGNASSAKGTIVAPKLIESQNCPLFVHVSSSQTSTSSKSPTKKEFIVKLKQKNEELA